MIDGINDINNTPTMADFCKGFNAVLDLESLNIINLELYDKCISLKQELDALRSSNDAVNISIYNHSHRLQTPEEKLLDKKYILCDVILQNLSEQIQMADIYKKTNTKGVNWTKKLIDIREYKMYYSIDLNNEIYLPIVFLYGLNHVIELCDLGTSAKIIDQQRDIYYFYEKRNNMIKIGNLQKFKTLTQRELKSELKEILDRILGQDETNSEEAEKIINMIKENRKTDNFYVKDSYYTTQGGKKSKRKSKRKPTRTFKKHRK